MKVLVVGDVHGRFDKLNQIINKKKPDMVLTTGDIAYYWPNINNIGKIKPGNTKVYLIPGNHSDWDAFEEYVGRNKEFPIEVEKNIFQCPIGSSIEINNKKIVFIGGADSIDKKWRILGISWWAQEILNQYDLDYILQNNKSADIILSHTCPKEFDVESVLRGMDGRYMKCTDPSRYVLSKVLEELKPNKWFFGHWHLHTKGTYKNTEWMCLDAIHYDGISKYEFEI